MILITGVNGFIGKHLFNFYKNIKGEKVLGFDKNFHLSFLDENIENLEFFDFVKDGRIEFIERFLSKLEEAEDKHLKIYHLASEVGVNFHDKTTFKSQMILNSIESIGFIWSVVRSFPVRSLLRSVANFTGFRMNEFLSIYISSPFKKRGIEFDFLSWCRVLVYF